MLKLKALALAAGMVGLSVVNSNAMTLSFDKVTSNTSYDASSQIKVDVTEGVGGAYFNFAAIAGSLVSFVMSELYWDDSVHAIFAPPPKFVSSSNGINGSVVSYGFGSANPGCLPSAQTAGFTCTAGLLADPGSNAPSKGVGIGEFLKVFVAYNTGFDFSNVTSAFNSGDLRLGIHAISHNGGGSESYVTVAPVPLPAAGLALVAGIGSLAALRRRRRA